MSDLRDPHVDPGLGLDALDVAYRLARANPPSSADGTRFLFELQSRGVDLTTIAEEDWRGIADALGLDELEAQDFIEDAASWMGSPVE